VQKEHDPDPPDLRAEVLAGIDREMSYQKCSEEGRHQDAMWPSQRLRVALRHLREIAERHLIMADDEGPYCGFCNTYLSGRPGCSVLLSLAPDYAPDALARMEASR